MARYTIDNQKTEIDFERAGDAAQRTLQNCRNLLMLRQGEIPYDRMRGLDASLVDMPIARVRERIMEELDRVMMWEPDAEVVDADVRMDGQGDLLITVTIDVNV